MYFSWCPKLFASERPSACSFALRCCTARWAVVLWSRLPDAVVLWLLFMGAATSACDEGSAEVRLATGRAERAARSRLGYGARRTLTCFSFLGIALDAPRSAARRIVVVRAIVSKF